jgi:hypothetical protein
MSGCLTDGVQLQADQTSSRRMDGRRFPHASNLSPPAAAATPPACQLQRALGGADTRGVIFGPQVK